jgi:MSHA pilin protein MshD
MPSPNKSNSPFSHRCLGVSLIEMVVFIVIVSIALLALIGVYRQATVKNVDPLIRIRALEAAQAKLDELLALKYDENTPSGGIPACSSPHAGSQACNNLKDANKNDVDDFHGETDTPYTGYTRSVTVVTNSNIKLITVSVSAPGGETLRLAAERANF